MRSGLSTRWGPPSPPCQHLPDTPRISLGSLHLPRPLWSPQDPSTCMIPPQGPLFGPCGPPLYLCDPTVLLGPPPQVLPAPLSILDPPPLHVSPLHCPRAAHDVSITRQIQNNWSFGETVDEEAKTHPMLRPYKTFSEKVICVSLAGTRLGPPPTPAGHPQPCPDPPTPSISLNLIEIPHPSLSHPQPSPDPLTSTGPPHPHPDPSTLSERPPNHI